MDLYNREGMVNFHVDVICDIKGGILSRDFSFVFLYLYIKIRNTDS